MSKLLHRFWFSFNGVPEFSPLNVGCGVTAFTHEDAVNLLNDQVLNDVKTATITGVQIDVLVTSLDQNHVIPNMGDSTARGIWFPLGYEMLQNRPS